MRKRQTAVGKGERSEGVMMVKKKIEKVEKGSGKEEKKKRGRPTNCKRINIEKSASTGRIDGIMKKNRGKQDQERGREQEGEKK